MTSEFRVRLYVGQYGFSAARASQILSWPLSEVQAIKTPKRKMRGPARKPKAGRQQREDAVRLVLSGMDPRQAAKATDIGYRTMLKALREAGTQIRYLEAVSREADVRAEVPELA